MEETGVLSTFGRAYLALRGAFLVLGPIVHMVKRGMVVAVVLMILIVIELIVAALVGIAALLGAIAVA
jgi:hypothetical protein